VRNGRAQLIPVMQGPLNLSPFVARKIWLRRRGRPTLCCPPLLPAPCGLYSLDEVARAAEAADAARPADILLRIAVQQPMLFVMEDLHWVAPGAFWVSRIVRSPQSRPMHAATC